MEVKIDNLGAFAVAKVTGDLRTDTAEQFTDALDEYASGTGSALAVDLSDVAAMDSSGLAALIQLATRARLAQGRVLLVAPSPFVSSILNVTRLDQWFEICPNLEEAQQRLAAG